MHLTDVCNTVNVLGEATGTTKLQNQVRDVVVQNGGTWHHQSKAYNFRVPGGGANVKLTYVGLPSTEVANKIKQALHVAFPSATFVSVSRHFNEVQVWFNDESSDDSRYRLQIKAIADRVNVLAGSSNTDVSQVVSDVTLYLTGKTE